MLLLLVEAYEMHMSVPEGFFSRRRHHWLSTSPPIDQAQSPYMGCVISKFLYQEGEDIVIRSMYVDQNAIIYGPMTAMESKRTTRMRGSIGTVVAAMLDSGAWRDQSLTLSDDERAMLIDKICSTYAAKKAAYKTDLTFEWIDDVVEAYRSWDGKSNSCMTGDNRCENTEVYDKTVGGRRIWALQATDPNGEFIGRCLVIKPSQASTISGVLQESPLADGDVPWNQNAVGWFAHRIYGHGDGAGYDNDFIRRMAGGMMKAFPWIRHDAFENSNVLCKIPSSLRLPYLDGSGSFLTEAETAGGRIILVFGNRPDGSWRHREATDYEGGPLIHEEDYCSCSDCGRGISEDDVTYVYDEPMCPRCIERNYYWSELDQEYVHVDNAIEVVGGGHVNRDSLPCDCGRIEYHLAQDKDGNDVAAPLDSIVTVFFDGDEECQLYVAAEDRDKIVKAKVVKLPDEFSSIHNLVITDEEIDVFVSDSRIQSNYMWKDSSGQRYVSRTRMPFGSETEIFIEVLDGKLFFVTDGHRVGFRSCGAIPGHLMCFSERDRWSMFNPITQKYVVENLTYFMTAISNNVVQLDIVAHTSHTTSLNDSVDVHVNGAGYCTVNDERTGQVRLIKSNFDHFSENSSNIEYDMEGLAKRIARTCRFSPGRFTISRYTDGDETGFIIVGFHASAIIGHGSSVKYCQNTNSFKGMNNVDAI